MKTTRVIVRGSGDIGSTVAHRLFMLGADVVLQDAEAPTHPRRGMAFTDAHFTGTATLDGVVACAANDIESLHGVWADVEAVPVTSIAALELAQQLRCDALVDARMRKRASPEDMRAAAPLTIGLGPGFAPGMNCHVAIETAWGSELGDVLDTRATAPLSGEPKVIGGAGRERFVYAKLSGQWCTGLGIGSLVNAGDVVGWLDGELVHAPISGALRGLTHHGVRVADRQKLVEVDPREQPDVFGLGERPKCIARGVSRAIGFEGVLSDAFFAFEAEYLGTLDCMPMSMRHKLDGLGLRLSLDQWRRLPLGVRETLLEAPGGSPRELTRLRAYLRRWVDKLALGALPDAIGAAEALEAGRCEDHVPTGLQMTLREHKHLPLQSTDWARLSEPQRYALLKLCASKSARNLQPALREFGLLT